MKTAEQILEEQCGTRKFRFHDVEGFERSEFDVIYAMEEYGKQCYNQALEDALNNVDLVDEGVDGESYYIVDKDSILKLKK